MPFSYKGGEPAKNAIVARLLPDNADALDAESLFSKFRLVNQIRFASRYEAGTSCNHLRANLPDSWGIHRNG